VVSFALLKSRLYPEPRHAEMPSSALFHPYKVVIISVIFRAPDNATVLTINLPSGGNDGAVIFMTRVMHGVHDNLAVGNLIR